MSNDGLMHKVFLECNLLLRERRATVPVFQVGHIDQIADEHSTKYNFSNGNWKKLEAAARSYASG